jgi:hypothetical protein
VDEWEGDMEGGYELRSTDEGVNVDEKRLAIDSRVEHLHAL